MSLFGALNASVTGVRSQSSALGVISDNIANVNNVGYKARRAEFAALVTQQQNASGFSAGGVSFNPVHEIGAQGQLQASQFTTDLAIEGDGMFAVKDSVGNPDENPFLYTRDGQFRVNDAGNLENSSGYLLHGWPIDGEGNLPANQQNPESTEIVNVNGFSGLAQATQNISLGANLPPDLDPTEEREVTTRVFDAEGNPHNLKVTFARNNGDGDALDGNQYRMTIEAPTRDGARSGTFNVNGNANPVDTITTVVEFNGDGAIKAFGVDPNNGDGAGLFQDAEVAGEENEFLVSNGGPDGGLPTAENPNFTFDLNFDAGADAPNGTDAAPAEGVSLNVGTPLAFDNANDPDGDGTEAVNGGIEGEEAGQNAFALDGLTSFDNNKGFQVNELEQDGLQFGNFTGVTVDDEGIVTAQFDNGQRRDIYKLPIVKFPNANGLSAESGDVFAETADSGVPLFNEAGLGGSGSIAPGSTEASTVDLADEFTKMITTQRAYSASTRVITTSDEMLQELTQAVR